MTGQSPKVKLTAEEVAAKLEDEGRTVDNSMRNFDNWKHPLRTLQIKRGR